jgi:hypothetical protein
VAATGPIPPYVSALTRAQLDLLRPVARSLTDDLRHSEDGPYWWAINGVHVLVTQAWQWR